MTDDLSVTSYRRYCLVKRQYARASGDNAIELVWRAKQEAEAGTDLPDDFPLLETLSALGYTTDEDLDGADADELTGVGLSTREAARVLAAFAALP